METIKITDFRELLGVPPGTYERGLDFQRKVIEPAVLEVNGLSDMKVEIAIQRKHARAPIQAVTLSWWRKSGDEFRDAVAEAGFEYVSDTHRLGAASPVRELPVLSFHGFPLGGGSYQRLLPVPVVTSAVGRGEAPTVLYYHSYDFGATLPGLGEIRSVAAAKQLLARGRVSRAFSAILSRYGSKACIDVER